MNSVQEEEREEEGLDDSVLSDVHLGLSFSQTPNAKTYFTSRYPIFFDHKEDDKENVIVESDAMINYDSDGDVVFPNRNRRDAPDEVISISHRFSTPLRLVGLQVWRGGLFLSDYLLHIHKNTGGVLSFPFSSQILALDGCCSLELGAGSGICSVVLARLAQKVFCTDHSEEILNNCLVNSFTNSYLYKHQIKSSGLMEEDQNNENNVIQVRRFDWSDLSLGKNLLENSIVDPNVFSNRDKFSWRITDIPFLNKIQMIVASDVIYEQELTDMLFFQLGSLLEGVSLDQKRFLLLGLEKRINFSMTELAETATAYDYMLEYINVVNEKGEIVKCSKKEGKQFFGMRVMAEFPQFLRCYERVPELELWYIWL